MTTGGGCRGLGLHPGQRLRDPSFKEVADYYARLLAWYTQGGFTDELAPGARELRAGRLGRIEVVGDQVMLGAPFVFDRGNIDRFDF